MVDPSGSEFCPVPDPRTHPQTQVRTLGRMQCRQLEKPSYLLLLGRIRTANRALKEKHDHAEAFKQSRHTLHYSKLTALQCCKESDEASSCCKYSEVGRCTSACFSGTHNSRNTISGQGKPGILSTDELSSRTIAPPHHRMISSGCISKGSDENGCSLTSGV